LAPDVLITQTHCEVCAVSPADVARGGATLCREQVVALAAGTLDDILEGFERIAAIVGVPEAGAALTADIRARLASVAERVRGRPRPKVACLEWIEPIFAMGNWGPELVALAGGESLLGTPGAHSTTIPWSAVRAADADVLLIAPCGFDL